MIKTKRKEFVNYFKLLEVSYLCEGSNLKSAYYSKAQLHHPDKGGKEKNFNLIKEAYDTLKDEEKRQKYIHKNIDKLFHYFIQDDIKRVVVEPKTTGYGTATSPLILGKFEKIEVEKLNTIFYVPKEKHKRYTRLLA